MVIRQLKNILWDFDGVILDSMQIRDEGFYVIFKEYPIEKVEQLMDFHRMNGGLSRYVKIRYFYNEVLQKNISDIEVNDLAAQFSEVMLQKLVNEELLIQDSFRFIKENHSNYNFHIVSGSDGKELKLLCQKLGIAKYFKSIQGSPTPKTDLVKNMLEEYNYNTNQTILIGDSKNDFEAALDSSIDFYGYNNAELLRYGNYIETFQNLTIK